MQLASPVPVSLREPLRRLAVVCGVAHAPHTRLALFAGRRAVSILSLDGGGTRALFSLQVLKKMERVLKKPLRETFDVIAGTSTGGILAIALGLLGMPLEKVEQLYTRLAKEVFSIQTRSTKGSSTVYNAGRALLFNRGMYNTPLLQAIFHHYAGTSRLFEHAAGNSTPRVFVLSTQIRGEAVKSPRPYLHANYRVSSRYTHGCLHTLCDALRATTAAPVFFDVMLDEDGLAFCDGGVLMNNPTAVAVHEARCIWPGREIGAVVSVGTGLFEGAINVAEANPSNVPDDPSLLRKGHTAQPAAGRSMVLRVAQAVLESATDTEAVHHTLQDLLDPDVYFRLNADIGGEELLLDEHRPEVLKRLKDVGESYCTSGEGAHLIRKLANKLGGRRGAKYGLWRGKVASYARL